MIGISFSGLDSSSYILCLTLLTTMLSILINLVLSNIISEYYIIKILNSIILFKNPDNFILFIQMKKKMIK